MAAVKFPRGYVPQFSPALDPARFGRYEKKSGRQDVEVIQGWIVSPPPGFPKNSRWVVPLHEDSDSSDSEHVRMPVRIPPGYRRKSVNVAWLEEIDAVPLTKQLLADQKKQGAVEIMRFVEKKARPWYLTKAELLGIPPGNKVQAIAFDRNWADTAFEKRSTREVSQ